MITAGRTRKLMAFLNPPASRAQLIPYPWRDGAGAYYVVNDLANPDGFGGYTRARRFDDDGVPYTAGRRERSYHPLVVARYGMRMLAIARAHGDTDAEEKARRVLPALIDSGCATGAWGPSTQPSTMQADTPSGMIQGVVISALIRLTDGNPTGACAEVIQQAASRLGSPISEGGVVSEFEGGRFIEEFVRAEPSHILNGCVYGLFGLYDLADRLGDRRAATLAGAVERTLERTIARFTTPIGWSRYALDVYGHAPLASEHYHRSHSRLMSVVAMRSRSFPIACEVTRWKKAARSHRVRVVVGAAKSAQVIWLRGARRLPLREG